MNWGVKHSLAHELSSLNTPGTKGMDRNSAVMKALGEV